MDFEASSVRTEDQFWNELNDLSKHQCDSHEEIDDVLRQYLSLLAACGDDNSNIDHDISRCTDRLLSSSLFANNADYIRLQIIYSLLQVHNLQIYTIKWNDEEYTANDEQEDSHDNLLGIVSFLLFDGCENEATFEMMCQEGAFCRLLELIMSLKDDDHSGSGVEVSLRRMLMDLFYEMSRIQRVGIEDLSTVNDEFVKYLFQIIEGPPEESNDPYHYQVIRVLLVLSEQFMMSCHDPVEDKPATALLTNRVVKVISMHGNLYKTFGENIILLLNREDETSLQLLTLKLLYLLFTTPSTYEYFYTNDLRVLVDILIRNLYDLPEDAIPLRHTYLRVLFPLLAHTQLKYPPHDKRDELQKLFVSLVRGQWSDVAEDDHNDYEKILHFNDVDDTTKRLVLRCGQVSWISEGTNWFTKELSVPFTDESVNVNGDGEICSRDNIDILNIGSPISPQMSLDENLHGHKASSSTSPVRQAFIAPIGQEVESGRSSTSSIAKVASHKETPGVILPNRGPLPIKQKPEPPMARRSRARRRAQSKDKDDGFKIQRNCRGSSESGLLKSQTDDKMRILEASTAPLTHYTNGASDCFGSRDTTVQSPESLHPSPYSHSTSLSQRKSHNNSPSNPPALPPPRRSSHSVPPPSHINGHRNPQPQLQQKRPSTRPPPPPPQHHNLTSRPLQKPVPPKTRRWRVHQQQEQKGIDEKVTCSLATERNPDIVSDQRTELRANSSTDSLHTPAITVEMIDKEILTPQEQDAHNN